MSCKNPPKDGKCSLRRQKYHTKSGRTCCRRKSRKSRRSRKSYRDRRSRRSRKTSRRRRSHRRRQNVYNQPWLMPKNQAQWPHQQQVFSPLAPAAVLPPRALLPPLPIRLPQAPQEPQQPQVGQVWQPPHEWPVNNNNVPNQYIRGQQGPPGRNIFDLNPLFNDNNNNNNTQNPIVIPEHQGQFERVRYPPKFRDFTDDLDLLEPRVQPPEAPVIAMAPRPSGNYNDFGASQDFNFGIPPPGQVEKPKISNNALLAAGQGQELQSKTADMLAVAMIAAASGGGSASAVGPASGQVVTKQDIADAKKESTAVIADAKAEIKQLDDVAIQANKNLDDEAKAKQLAILYYRRLDPHILAVTEKWIPNILKIMRDNNIPLSKNFDSILSNSENWLFYIKGDTVGWYTSDGYIQANKWLVSSIRGTLPAPNKITIYDLIYIARVLLLREIVISAQYPIDLNVWRWSNQEENNVFNVKYSNLKKYNTLQSETNIAPFQSTSLSKQYVYEYAADVVERFDEKKLKIDKATGQVSMCCIENIVIPKGTPCLYTGGNLNEEFEVLLPPCMQFVVTKTRLESQRGNQNPGNIVTLKSKPREYKKLSDDMIAWLCLYVFTVNHMFHLGTTANEQIQISNLIESMMRKIYATEFMNICQ